MLNSERTVEDISFLQGSSVWDAVANDFIDRRAAGFGEVVVVQRGGVAVPCCAGLNRQNMVVLETAAMQQVRQNIFKQMCDPLVLVSL